LALGLSSVSVLRAQDAAPATPPPATTPPADAAAPAPAAPSDDAAPKPKKRGGGTARQLNFLAEKLTLTDDQKTKVGAILKDQMGQMKTVHDDTTLSDDDRKAKLAAVNASTKTQIRALLTDDQKATYDALPPMGGEHHKKAE
jgi:periplasmic protein CpxP/Spy